MAVITGNTGFKVPSAQSQDTSVGTVAWLFPSRVLADDGSAAQAAVFVTSGTDMYIHDVRIVLDNVLNATNKISGAPVLVLGGPTYTIGGSGDTWSQTLTGVDIKRTGFGFAVSIRETDGTPSQDYLILMTGYGVTDLADSATVTGMELEVQANSFASGGGTFSVEMDTARAKVYWSWEPTITGGGSAAGAVYIGIVNQNDETFQKKYRYRVTDADNNFVGDWKDVESEPEFKQQINNIRSTMEITMARNDILGVTSVENLFTESDEQITSESDEALQIDTAAPKGLGSGTNLDLNFNVEIDAFYGEFVGLLTEDDEPMYTEDWHLLMVQDGAPEGRSIFRGYISRWELDFGGDDKIRASLMSHAAELGNIMLETDDVLKDTFTTWANMNDYWGTAGGGPDDNDLLAQTFTAASSYSASKIRLKMREWASGANATLYLRTGGTPGSGTLLATATASPQDYVDFYDLDFIFDDVVSITNTSVYNIVIESDQNKTGGNVTYPIQWAHNTSGGYAGGNGWYINSYSGWTSTGGDFIFSVYQAGGATTRTYTSTDPSEILKSVLSFAQGRGARVNYDIDGIDNTGTTTTFTFNANTIEEAIKKVLELSPADWYYWYDPGTDEIFFRARPTTAERFVTLGTDIQNMKLRRSIENLVNLVYFTGGGNPAIFDKTVDATSISDWRTGLRKLSDSRVTTLATADILSQAEINRHKDPEYEGGLTIIDKKRAANGYDAGHYEYIEDVLVGEMLGFTGFGNFIDDLVLQIVERNYRPDTLDIGLETLLPPVPKRVEQLRKELEQLQAQYNPTSPS